LLKKKKIETRNLEAPVEQDEERTNCTDPSPASR